MIPEHIGFFVYLLLCEDGSYYCGWTTNLKKRYVRHCKGKGAKYTRSHKPKSLYYYEELSNASGARKREYEIKQFTHKQKEMLRNNVVYKEIKYVIEGE